MSDIRFNQWLHQSGTGGVSQDHIGNIGIGTTNPSIVVSAANTAVLNVGVITANNLFVNNAFNGDITGNVTGNISGATGTFSGNVDIADKIIHTGDTDTAMRFPADNTFAVDTAGSERFRIDSNGNIGIGVNNPSSFNSDGRNLVVGTGSGGQGISIYSANNSYGTIYFADGTSGSELYRGGLLYNHASDFLRFDTAGAERLRITSAGEVRQQSTGGSTIYELKRSDANTTGSVGTINYTASDGHSVASMSAIGDGDNEGAHLVFRTTSAAANNSPYNAATPERLRITSDGKIGVGVASPSEMMEITNTGGTGTQIQLRDTSTGTGSGDGVRFGYNGSGAQIWNFESTYIRFATSNAERLRITSDGKLGHGTASPSSAFHGTVSSGGYGATFESTANGGESVVTIKGKKSDGTVRSAIFKYDNADMIRLGTSQAIPMRFETSDTERLHITAAGEIGINANSNWTNGTTLLVQANPSATGKSMISVRGGATGYVHSALKLSATTHSNSGGNQRGLGVFMHDEASSVEWFAGRPYSQSDYFLITRKTSVSAANAGGETAQHSQRKWQLDSIGRTVQSGGIYTYQPGHSGGKTSRAFEAKGASGTYSSVVVDVEQNSYGTVAWDIKVGGYSSRHMHVAGTYYCNGGLYANYTSINNSSNVSYTRAFVSGQKIRHTFGGTFIHPICEVTATVGGDGYFDPGDITITWS